MTDALAEHLAAVADVVRRFGLASFRAALQTCEVLFGGGSPLDLAVLGQFKSGKSSLLNAVLGQAVFPVGVLPVTAIITRATAAPQWVVRVISQSGAIVEVPPDRLADYVTEAGSPENRRQVAVVAAVLNESVNAGVIQDEFRLAEQRVCGSARPVFEKVLLPHQGAGRARVYFTRPRLTRFQTSGSYV